KLVVTGTIIPELHYGPYLCDWWIFFKKSQNVPSPIPICLGLEPGYICEGGRQSSDIVTSSSNAITLVYQAIFGTKTKFASLSYLGLEQTETSQKLLEGVVFYPFIIKLVTYPSSTHHEPTHEFIPHHKPTNQPIHHKPTYKPNYKSTYKSIYLKDSSVDQDFPLNIGRALKENMKLAGNLRADDRYSPKNMHASLDANFKKEALEKALSENNSNILAFEETSSKYQKI
ncbi:12976_t:CDS:2, partial [Racocetra persica]